MTLQKARVTNEVDLLTYYSKVFSIRTDWDGGRYYTIEVYNEVTRELIEIQQVVTESFVEVEEVFEGVKTKYILSGI